MSRRFVYALRAARAAAEAQAQADAEAAQAAAAEAAATPPTLAPSEAAALRYLAKHPDSTSRDITRNVRGVGDAVAVLNRLLELGLAARRADDRKGKGRRAAWLYSVDAMAAP